MGVEPCFFSKKSGGLSSQKCLEIGDVLSTNEKPNKKILCNWHNFIGIVFFFNSHGLEIS